MSRAHKLGVASPCPTCGRTLDAATGVGHGQHPQPGDISICAYCGTVSEFTETLNLQKIPDDLQLPEMVVKASEAIKRRIN